MKLKLFLYVFGISLLFNTVSHSNNKNDLFRTNSSNWVQTNGPGGGYISDIVINYNDPSILYAVGSREGIYKSTNSGEKWELIRFNIHVREAINTIMMSHDNPDILYGIANNDLIKSVDAGNTWQRIFNNMEPQLQYAKAIGIDPNNSNILYVGGGCHCDDAGGTVYMTENGGDSWTNIGANLNVPVRALIESIGIVGDQKLYVAVNDERLETWHKGKVFYTENNGEEWTEVSYGQFEDRFIECVFVNPFNTQEIWIGERSLYNQGLDQPTLFKSGNNGESWEPLYCHLTTVIGASSDGKVFFGGPFYTADCGESFIDIEIPPEILGNDMYHIAIHPTNSNILYLPTRAGGIAYSENGGFNWVYRNNGILNTRINLIAVAPNDPAVVYSASSAGNGTFRSDDYGENWKYLNPGGIVHQWSDELVVDPVSPDNVWFVADVPYLHKSVDRGDHWSVINHPYESGKFNFGSVYAIGGCSDHTKIYAINSGFGIFKGHREWIDESFHWQFKNLSEVDYSYSLAVDPSNSDILFSGYSRKPFENKVKIMGTYDGGENWFTSLEVMDAEAVTSVIIDPVNTNNLYAASTGDIGGALWHSADKGQSWQPLNEYFNFTTIHSFAVANDSSPSAYAGVWGGGTYLTNDYGDTWEKLEAKNAFSAAAIAVDPGDADIVYLADRTNPVLHKSVDGGKTWQEFFNAGTEYRRLMCVTIDPSHPDRVYVSAMKTGGPGKLGGVFKIENGIASNINGIITKVPLTITIDPNDVNILYAVLHESGVYKSDDGGNTWSDISGSGSNLPESGFNNLIIDPNNSNTLYLIGGCDVLFSTFESAGLDPEIVNTAYKSTDGGLTWENLHRNILGEKTGGIKSLVFYNNSSDLIYLGTENGVYYSTDGGNEWRRSSDLPYNTLGGIAVSGTTIYAFTNGAGLFTGTIQNDHSINWDVNPKIKSPVYFAQILKDRTDNNSIYASGYPGGIFKSSDNGATWHEKNFGMVSFKVDDPLRQGYYALAQSNSNPDVFYLGLFEKGVYRSTNRGETWYPVNGQMWEMSNKNITSLVVDNQNENIVYVASDEGVHYTTNGGQDWTSINEGLVSLDVKSLCMSQNNNLYAGTRGYGLYQLNSNRWFAHNGFGEWGTFWPMWDNRPMYQYTSLLIHPDDNSRMIIGTFPQGIYKSSDGGHTWKESNLGWTNDGVFSLVCHPDNPEIVYAGTYNGMNRSLDFGDHWEMWDNGMPGEQWVFSIDFDPTNPDIMYTCSKNGENEGRGVDGFRGTVMKSTDGGANWFEITDGLVIEGEGLQEEYYKIIVDHYDPNILYLAGQHEGIYKSRNGGDSWELWNDGLTNHTPGTNGNNVTNCLAMSADHSMLYFGTDGTGVWRRMISPILPVNNLSAEVQNHKIILQWKFDDLNNNFSHYNIYKADDYFNTINDASLINTVSSVLDTFYMDENILPGNSYYYAVTTNDNAGYENEHFFVLGPVVEYPLQITTTYLDTGRVDVAYRDTLEAMGGISPFSWEIISGSLPTGLEVLSSTGIIRGIPGQAGDFQFAVKVTDSDNPAKSDSANYHLMINQASDILKSDESVPEKFVLKQNFPNPFNLFTSIEYEVPIATDVRITVYDLSGRIVYSFHKKHNPGRYVMKWNGTDKQGNNLASGLYLYEIETKYFKESRRMILLK